MFIRDSRKRRFVLSTILVALIGLIVVHGAMLALSRWAEVSAGTYPYRSEDWLRYFLSTLHDGHGDRLLLAGESAVRENFILERFQEDFPELIVIQGGLSLGTLDDVLVSLDYMQLAYGEDNLPKILVLGVSPRFVANLPDGKSPLVAAINRYSRYRVVETADGSRLEFKGWRERWTSEMRFQTKQQARFRSALATLLHEVFPSDVPYGQFSGEFDEMRAALSPGVLWGQGTPEAAQLLREIGLRSVLGRWLRVYISPYKYHYLKPLSEDSISTWLSDPESFWDDVHAWNPRNHASRVKKQFGRLLRFVRQREISLYVVNLPENPISRRRYTPENYSRYVQLVRECLGNTPFLDLRNMLDAEDFYDVNHARLPSALRVTDRVISFIEYGMER